MTKTVFTSALSMVLALGTVINSSAQCSDYKWPEDGEAKAKAQESIVLLKDNKTNQPKVAIPPFNWLVANAPDLNKSIYIYGADIYSTLAKKEKDGAKQAKYVDSLAIVYDLRLKYTPCDEEGSIMERKALAAYPYYINTEKAKELLKYMQEALKLAGNDLMDVTLVPYMQTVQVNKIKFKNMTDEDVLNEYDKLISVLDAKRKEAKTSGTSTARYDQDEAKIEDILLHTIKLNCDLVNKIFVPKYKANTSDIDMAKKVFNFLLIAKCTDDPLWLETGEAIVKDAAAKGEDVPFGIAKNLGVRYLQQDNFEKAKELLKVAQAAASSDSDKADILIYLGSIESNSGNKSTARNLYREAVSLDPEKKDAYERIGDMYMNSFSSCAKKQSMAEDRLIYIAAYNMYSRAGNSQKMAQARAQFPSKTELFEKNWKVGETQSVGCWIGETVTLQVRPE